MAFSLVEVKVKPRNQNLVVFFRRHNSRSVKIRTAATHWLFRITLPDGSNYAVDFANAQFARMPTCMQFHGITPWHDYMAHLQLAEADFTGRDEPTDFRFLPNKGPYNQEHMRRAVNLLLYDHKVFDVNRRDRMTLILTWFSLVLSIENCLVKRFANKDKPTIFLTELLVGPAPRFVKYKRRILGDLRLFLLTWRLVLGFGGTTPGARETPKGFLLRMWNLLAKATRGTHGGLQDLSRSRNATDHSSIAKWLTLRNRAREWRPGRVWCLFFDAATGAEN
jgi:hypothetical protein